MSETNPFFAAQERQRLLIQAAPYFAGLRADQILTQQPGDLQFLSEEHLLQLDFGVVITTGSGKPLESSYEALLSMEESALTIIHTPLVDGRHNALEALFAIIRAVHGAPVVLPAPAAPRDFDCFAFVSHQRMESAVDKQIHEVRFRYGLRLC